MRNYVLAATLAMTTATAGQAATLINGSFEDPEVNARWQTIGAGSTALTGWTVGGRGVDLIDTFWEASDGDQSVDMSAGGAGTLSQMITDLVIGQEYRLFFDLSANSYGGSAVKNIDVTVGAVSGSYSFDTGGVRLAANNMMWETNEFRFIATDTSELLTFTGRENSAYGAALDNVSVAAVPLPATAALLGLGLLGLGAARRRS